jgi:hypothetical protein
MSANAEHAVFLITLTGVELTAITGDVYPPPHTMTVRRLRETLAAWTPESVVTLAVCDDQYADDGVFAPTTLTVGSLRAHMTPLAGTMLVAFRVRDLTSNPGDVGVADVGTWPGVAQLETYMDIADVRGKVR